MVCMEMGTLQCPINKLRPCQMGLLNKRYAAQVTAVGPRSFEGVSRINASSPCGFSESDVGTLTCTSEFLPW